MSSLRAVFVDASPVLAQTMRALHQHTDIPVHINENEDVTPEELPTLLGDARIMLVDHTSVPTEIAKQCPGLRDIVFLGTGAASYMNIDELAGMGIRVHLIRGYGDTAVAECAFALMWTAAKEVAFMDREMRAGNWQRTDVMQLTGKTLGLLGLGGIGKEMARLALGVGMRVIAWNRTPRECEGVTFVDSIEELISGCHVLSLHLLLSDETRGILNRERLAMFRPGAILVNTARGALIDEEALIDALRSGPLLHGAFDVFAVEPLPADHPFTTMPNVTLSAHSAFRTPEASNNLIEASLQHCRNIAAQA